MFAGALLVALFVTGCGGGDSESNVAATATDTIRHSGPTVAVLQPVGEMRAAGTARYSVNSDGSRSISLNIHGLEPAAWNRQYVVWQKHSRNDMVILATWPVGADRRLVESWEPNSASQRFLEDGSRTKLLITRIELNDRLTEPGAARNSYEHVVIGKPVLEGQFEGALVGAREGE